MADTVQANIPGPALSGSEAALERCLRTLKTAQSDTEMFAALFLITKLAKAETMDTGGRQRIFDAVGFQFISRLLHTDSPPEDCDEHMFQSLALTLLACFSTDSDLARHPELHGKIPVLGETILLPKSGNPSAIVEGMITDAYDILLAMSASEEGREKLQGITGSLVTVLTEKLHEHTRALSLLCLLLHHDDGRLWAAESASLNSLFSKLAQDFHLFQDEEKFQTCYLLNSLLSVTSSVPPTMPEWAVKLGTTLSGVLRNKLGEVHRDVCLQLAATMLHHYGAAWVLSDPDRKFFLLLVNLASIEVRMILETMDQEKQQAKAAVLCSCFCILEQCVQVMVCHPEVQLSQGEVRQLHGTLTGAFGAAIFHLKTVDFEQINDPVVISCVRALFMWLAEETAQLKTEVIEILPFLIKFSRMSLHGPAGDDQFQGLVLPRGVFYLRLREDLIKLFLPGLCHLTAEDEPRNVILRSDSIRMLVAYTVALLKNRQENESSLTTLCNIFLNVTLQDSGAVRGHGEFRDLLHTLCSQITSTGSSQGTLLDLHLALVFVTILRILPEDEGSVVPLRGAVTKVGSLIRQIITRDARGSPQTISISRDEEETLENLLCLIMQCLTECLQGHEWVASSLSDANLVSASSSSFERWKEDSDVMSQYASLCSALSRSMQGR